MSNEEKSILPDRSEETTRDFKDDQLQIVELAPYTTDAQQSTSVVVADGSENSNEGLKYMQLGTSKNMLVDYLNLSFVRCENGQEEYRLVSNGDSSTTVTCVLANDDGDIEGEDQENGEAYVMVEGEEGPLVFLQSTLQQANTQPKPEKKPQNKALTPAEILEKAKALQKVKAHLLNPTVKRGPGRRRKSDLPPPHELLTSPQFKLYLYSCKFCSFRCNAIKELTAHKAAEHGGGRISRGGGGVGGGRGGGGGGGRGGGGRGPVAVVLQCARCPFSGHTHSQLMRHVKEKHLETIYSQDLLDSNPEVDSADVLVCGACGYESQSKITFKKHIEDIHGAISC